MQFTLAELTVKLMKPSLPATWRYVVKHNWPYRIDPVRGVVIDAPLGEVREGEWEGFRTWSVKNEEDNLCT